MAAIGTRTGVGGNVTLHADFGLPTNLTIVEWREDRTRDALDDTNFATTNNARQVIGGRERSTITVKARADRADVPAMSSMASAIGNTNEQPVLASLTLKEGVIGTTGVAAQTVCAALLASVDRGVIKGQTVDYNLTFRRSGVSADTS